MRVLADLDHRRSGECAERVERDVAHELDPDVIAEVGLDGGLQTSGNHGVTQRFTAGRDLPRGLADGKPGALQMPYHSRCLDRRRWIHHAADGPLRRQHGTGGTAGIHGLDLTPLVWPGQLVEIPPWDPVLRGQHRGVLAEQWLHERTAGRIAMRLEAEEDIVDGPDVRGVVGGVGVGHEIASRTENLHTVLSHRTQVLVARDQVDFGTSSVQRGTPVGADRSGTDDCNSHGDSLLCILYGQPRPAYGASRALIESSCIQYAISSTVAMVALGRWRRRRTDFLPGRSQEEENDADRSAARDCFGRTTCRAGSQDC